MSDMKCPKCGGRLVYWGATGALLKCSQCNFGWGNEELWQELIRTRKTLEQSEICCTEWEKQALDYKAENINLSDKIGKLETELERTRKALEIATKCINWVIDTFQKGLEHESEVVGCCELSLEQITALEQKD